MNLTTVLADYPYGFFVALIKYLQGTHVIFAIKAIDCDVQLLSSLATNLQVNIQTVQPSEIHQIRLSNSLILDNLQVFKNAKNRKCFQKDVFWLLSRRDSASDQLPDSLNLNSNFFSTYQEGDVIVLNEWYRLQGTLHEQFVGTWDAKTGLNVPTPAIWDRRGNLHGIRLRVATMPRRPSFVIPRKGSRYEGFIPSIMSVLENALNFTTDWTEPPDGQYGMQDDNGSWVGLMGMIQKGEADLAAALLTITFDRSLAVDFSIAFMEGRATLVVRNPAYFSGSSKVNLNAYLVVFTWPAWLFLIVGVLFLFLSHLILTDPKLRSGLLEIYSSLTFVYATMLKLSSTMGKQKLSAKIFSLVAAFFGFVIVAHYEALLTSEMTTGPVVPSLKSYSDAMDHGYKIVMLDGAALLDTFRLAPPASARRIIYEKKLRDDPSHFFPKHEEMYKVALSDPLIAMEEIDIEIEHDKRFLPLSLDEVFVHQMGFAFEVKIF